MIWRAQTLKDDAFSSSSDFNKNHAANSSRLNATEGKANWSAKTNDQNQWLQVDLGQVQTIAAVAIQGRFNSPQWVTKYDLLISPDQKTWERFANIEGVNDQDTVAIFQLPRSVAGRFVRFLPKAWHEHISMRIDVATTPIDIIWKVNSIKDGGFSSSSDFNEDHAAKFGRLHLNSGQANWSAKTNDKNQWIQVDLGNIQSVVAVAVQGRFNYKQWVTKYDLHISSDLQKWEKIENITGSANQESIVEFILPQPLSGRYVRFLPQEWYKHISMRVDVGVENLSTDKTPVENGPTPEGVKSELKSKKEAEKKAKKDPEVKTFADAKIKADAELKAKKETEEKAKKEAEERAKIDAELKAKKEAEEKAKKDAETKAKKDTEEKVKSGKFKPITPTKTWQPFLKEVCRKLHQNNILFKQYFDTREYLSQSTYDSNPLPAIPKYPNDFQTEINRFSVDLDKWTDFLVKEEYLLTAPVEENWILSEIGKIINFDKNKLDKIYGPNNQVIGELPKQLIESRKNYPTLLRHYLSRIMKMDKIPVDGWLWSAIKKCEPDVYKDFVDVYSTFSYVDSEKYFMASNFTSIGIFNDNDRIIPVQVYRDFIPAYMTLRNKIYYTLEDIPKFHELKMWEVNRGGNDGLFSNYISDYFWTRSDLRNLKSFDEIFNKIKKEKLHSFNSATYKYINPNSWQDKELWIRHIRLLEFLVESGRSDLADELYIDKMEFENRFKK